MLGYIGIQNNQYKLYYFIFIFSSLVIFTAYSLYNQTLIKKLNIKIQEQNDNLSKLEIKYNSSVRYKELFKYIRNGFSYIHDIPRTENDIKDIFNNFEKFCNSISEGFTYVKNFNCSVCIKIVNLDENKLYVQTVSRSIRVGEERKLTDGADVLHDLELNSDFFQVFTKFKHHDKRHYFSNNLLKETMYCNTSFPIYHSNLTHEGFSDNVSYEEKLRLWKLPYKSTIIVPITPLNNGDKNKIKGFLCIDSSEVDIFEDVIDIDILKGVSDGIYNELDNLLKKMITSVADDKTSTYSNKKEFINLKRR